jgi:ComF family protein
MRHWVDRQIERLGGLVLPPRCVLCGGTGQRPCLDLCHACEHSLPLAAPAFVHGPPPLQACFAPFAYGYPVDHLVHALKYRGQLAVARVLGVLLGRRLAAASRDRIVDVVVPVPLHPRRHAERGFNQSAEIARWTARVLRCRLDATLAARCRDTQPQVGLRGAERRSNLDGAFAAGRPVRGLRVALVDDVVTTGTTLGALALALNAAGARSVEAWCVGRAPPPKRVNSALDLEVPPA